MDRKKWPTFFIVGAAKAGTTSLYFYLKEHPQVFMSSEKEPHFFSRVRPLAEQKHIVKSITDNKKYLDLFVGAEGFRAIGEASPSYLWSEEAPNRIRKKSPDARILILLRDPIDRTFSHYLMDVREGWQKHQFYEALLRDFNQLEKGWGVSHLYVELGLYYQQVKRYLDAFGTRQVLILMYEDLKLDPRKVMGSVADFLGLDHEYLDHIRLDRVHNPYAVPKNKLVQHLMGIPFIREISSSIFPVQIRTLVRNKILLKKSEKPLLDPEARAFLQNIYEPEIRCLENMLGENLSMLRKTWQ